MTSVSKTRELFENRKHNRHIENIIKNKRHSRLKQITISYLYYCFRGSREKKWSKKNNIEMLIYSNKVT